MKYYAAMGNQTLEIEIEGYGEDLNIKIDGEAVPVSVRQVSSPSLYSIILGNDSHELLIEEREGEYLIHTAGQTIPVKVQSERSRRMAALAPAASVHKSDLAVRTPMPGLVVSVAVKAGSLVDEGDGLLVLEAMKMLNEVKAPKSGLVKKVDVRPGDIVESGQILIHLAEPA